ncbi:DASH complex subunit Dad1-domain-containing protein [Apiospora rasikravindrae]|uniref:DASH complex subunit DAD1 n=1 Tax=Apiospora rasikravindrae TaxID=990691 RepID=A0ABR1SWF5_9PEZI
MSTNQRPASAFGMAREKTFFEQQRELLIGEIAMNFEHVLANINKLNRSLEAVIAVGHEFSSVEALWSQFEGVMAKEPDQPAAAGDETMGGGDETKQEQEDDDDTAHVKEEGEEEDKD